MTFTYTPSATPTDTTLVRYHIGDTVEAAAIFDDETIGMVLAVEGSVGKAVVSLIKATIAKLSHEPDMTADWLTISWRRSSADWLKLLAEKQKEFGVGVFTISTSTVKPYRSDSLQGYPAESTETYEPDYHDSRTTDYTDVDEENNPPFNIEY
jgi:hypothetical protein